MAASESPSTDEPTRRPSPKDAALGEDESKVLATSPVPRAPAPAVTMRTRRVAAWRGGREVVRSALEHGIGRMAAALAYFALFSLPALLVFVLALAGMTSSYESVEERFLTEVREEVGARGADAIREMIRTAERLQTASSTTLWLGIASLMFGALGFFLQLQGALNVIFGAKPRARPGFLTTFSLKRILSFGMILGIAAFLLLSLALSTLLAAFGEHLAGWVPRVAPALLRALDLLLNTALTALLFAGVYLVLPDVRLGWRDVRLGAVTAAAAFSIGKIGIGMYLAHSSLASGYGAAGSLVVLLVWTYFSALVLLGGAEVARLRAHGTGRGGVAGSGTLRTERGATP